MNHTVKFSIIVLLFIALSGCIDIPEGAAPNETANVGTSATSSASDNTPMKCVFEISADTFGVETKNTSTVYLADGKVRFDTSIEKEGEVNEKYAIFDEEWMYSWGNSGILPGKKVKLSDEAKEANKKIYAVPSLNGTGYECEIWSPVDLSKFVPPKDIEFMNITK